VKLVLRGMAITIAALTLVGGALAAPVETVLYSFKGGNSDGLNPYAGLIADEQGALYGTTVNGGSGSVGTVFELTPPAKGQKTWKETVLYSFSAGGSDGISPEAGLIFDKEGALYGTTYYGGYGVSGCHPDAVYAGCGTVFRLTSRGQKTWKETVLYSFTGGSDGAFPVGGLIADEQGALYGTTSEAGSGGNGTVFRLTPPAKGQKTWTKSVLYSFAGGSDGGYPTASLIVDEQGALYSTTARGRRRAGRALQHNGARRLRWE
jgi:uncharacterized repeat protein (TIGR03803 family)